MHVFVWEALTAGVWPDVPASMRRQGGAMLAALVADLLRIDGCRVSTIEHTNETEPATDPFFGPTFLSRNGPSNEESTCPPFGVHNDFLSTVNCHTPDDESAAFDRFAATVDVCWLIAPETHGLLAERCGRVEAVGVTLVGPSSSAVKLCGDKLELASFLESRGIPTIPTQPVGPEATSGISNSPRDLDFPIVVKPRVGAGSEGMRLLRSPAEWPICSVNFNPRAFVWQKLHSGVPVSVAAIVGSERAAIDVFPVCRQHLADDGTFAYLGGEFPVATQRTAEIEQLVRRVCRQIDGLRGYIGFDLIIPDNPDRPVVVVEINPRLTTSYVGYRQLTAGNIAEWAIRGGNPILWNTTPLRFFPDGRCIGGIAGV